MFRSLAGNPTAKRMAEKPLELEDQHTAEDLAKSATYPWMGAEWFDIPAPVQTLNMLVVEQLLVTGGPRGTFKSNSSQTYKLKDPELVRECLA